MKEASTTGKPSFMADQQRVGSTVAISKQGYDDLIKADRGKNVFWTSEVSVELPIRMSTGGIAQFLGPRTIPAVFEVAKGERPDSPALRVQRPQMNIRGGTKQNASNPIWIEQTWSWMQYWDQCRAFAKSLHEIGVQERKAVNIMGFNSPEWAIAFYGAIFHNNIVSGVYITNGPDACKYQALHSEAQVIACDTIEQLRQWRSLRMRQLSWQLQHFRKMFPRLFLRRR